MSLKERFDHGRESDGHGLIVGVKSYESRSKVVRPRSVVRTITVEVTR